MLTRKNMPLSPDGAKSKKWKACCEGHSALSQTVAISVQSEHQAKGWPLDFLDMCSEVLKGKICLKQWFE